MTKKRPTAAWLPRLRELEARVTRLEHAQPSPQPAPADATKAHRGRARSSLALVDELRRSAHASPEENAGSVVYAGACRIGAEEYVYVREHGVPALLGTDPGKAARLLSSLGNPARLSLLLQLLAAEQSSADLQGLLGEGSTGQLYHHLRELQVAGLLVQPRRGVYRLAPHAAVSLLTIVAAAADLASGATEIPGP
jgi:hypothetical protein